MMTMRATFWQLSSGVLPLVAGLLTMAAAPEPALPVPPVPPVNPTAGITAPVPDNSIQAPTTVADESLSVRPEFYRSQPFTSGQGSGYLPGSRYKDNEEQKPIQTPGFVVTVPLR
jgi:hypothetical protein